VDFTPSDEQTAASELAARLFATAEPAERGLAGFDAALWDRLAESDLLGIAVPEEAGGGGQGLAEATVVAEECGRAAARAPVVPALAALGTLAGIPRPRNAELLAAGVAGRAIVVPALPEEGTDDPYRPTMAARRRQDGWELSGSLPAVPWAAQATHLLSAARSEDGETLLLAPATKNSGLAVQSEESSSGEPHATVSADGLRVADAEVLARGTDGAAALQSALTRLTLLRCAHALGIAEAALATAASHVSQREQFGRPLATFQGVTGQVADRWIDVEAMRLTLQQAVWRLDEGLAATEETAVAALWAAEGVHRVTETAVHLHGGLGVDVSYPLHRYFLAGKVDELTLGGTGRGLERLGGLLARR
jgi:alkylation response protein AidB-like acyl-CoA dehydrogenase